MRVPAFGVSLAVSVSLDASRQWETGRLIPRENTARSVPNRPHLRVSRGGWGGLGFRPHVPLPIVPTGKEEGDAIGCRVAAARANSAAIVIIVRMVSVTNMVSVRGMRVGMMAMSE